MTKVEFCLCKVPLFETNADGTTWCTTCNKSIPEVVVERAERSTKEKPGFYRGAKVSRR